MAGLPVSKWQIILQYAKINGLILTVNSFILWWAKAVSYVGYERTVSF